MLRVQPWKRAERDEELRVVAVSAWPWPWPKHEKHDSGETEASTKSARGSFTRPRERIAQTGMKRREQARRQAIHRKIDTWTTVVVLGYEESVTAFEEALYSSESGSAQVPRAAASPLTHSNFRSTRVLVTRSDFPMDVHLNLPWTAIPAGRASGGNSHQ